MAQKKKAAPKKSSKATNKNTNNKAAPGKGFDIKTLFSSEHKQVAALISFFVGLLLAAFIYAPIDGWLYNLKCVFYGLFGITIYVLPLFICFVSVVAAIGRDSKKYKIKVIEGFILVTLIAMFMHIVTTDGELTYGEQIVNAYKVASEDLGVFDYGVFGALFGGLPFIITNNKIFPGISTILVFIALLMIFSGTSLLKLLQSLKAPAEAVGEYAEEKIEDIKTSYTELSESRQEKRARVAEKRRGKTSQHEINLDIPIDDDGVVIPDKGVDPILTNEIPVTDRDAQMAEIIDLFVNDGTNEPEEELIPIDALEDKTVQEVQFENIIEAIDEPEEYVDEAVVEIDDEPYPEEEPEEIEPVEDVEPVIEEPAVVYELPPVDLLDPPRSSGSTGSASELREKGETIVRTLKSFGVGTRIVEICQSPSVTRFELQPDPGVKISRITSLADDIAMNLAASGVRIEAPIPNKNAVGIEVPNAEKAMVTLREILENNSFKNSKSRLNVALGRDIQGEATCADLAKMPHLLVAGTTGSGKSVCLNTMIMSLLYNATPEEVKLIMIDPKKVEFTVYRSIPHLLVPVVADPRKAAGALSWAVAEMDKRYALFAEKGVRNLQGYNAYALSNNLPKMPQIVIIIDELSDLMMAASNEVEDSICRLAQKARAAGMHLIVATQRPSVDVITGLIKANIPSRIAFAVKSQIDSRTIIDTQGAEKLLGNGDMLYCPVGLSKPVRVQGCYVSDDEIERVIEFVTSQGDVKYDDAVMQEIELKAAQDGKKKSGATVEADTGSAGDYGDEMIPKAIEVVVEAGMASTTLLQRKLKLGYARAARIVDELSEMGIIGPFEGSKPRKVLITKDQWYEM